MNDNRKRQRTESMIKISNQKRESKLWYEEANSHVKGGNLAKAINAYNKALELNPTEKNALVARSKCYILLGQPKNALQDAELALQIDKHFIKAIYQKAEALYYLGDFELSLMFYHRGLHVRPDHEGFKLGVHKAQKAIENAIGTISGVKGGGKRAENGSHLPEEESRNLSPESKSSNKLTLSVTNTKKTTRKSRLLRELEADKQYLDDLMNNPDIKCKYKENNNAIEKCIKETVEYLDERQEFWRQQLPPNLK